MDFIRVADTAEASAIMLEGLRYECAVIPAANPVQIALPGGRSVAPFIDALMEATASQLSRLRLYLIDERLSEPFNTDDIMKMGLRQLITQGRMREDQFIRPDLTLPPEAAAAAYARVLPAFSMIIAGVGEDGHVASLFPGRPELISEEDAAVVRDAPKPPPHRITLTPHLFRRHRAHCSAVLLFFGEAKQDALQNFMKLDDPAGCPASIFKGFSHLTVLTDLEV